MKGFQAGSKGYLAPEVVVGEEYSNKCDVFSFGCLVYLLLSGKKLFSGLSNSEIEALTYDNRYVHAEIDKLQAPKALKSLVKKVLDVDPEKRISAR